MKAKKVFVKGNRRHSQRKFVVNRLMQNNEIKFLSMLYLDYPDLFDKATKKIQEHKENEWSSKNDIFKSQVEIFLYLWVILQRPSGSL